MDFLYHETRLADVGQILKGGFLDQNDCGVYLSDKPRRGRDARDSVIIAIAADHISQVDLDRWERTRRPNANDYREWCIPASILNLGARNQVD